MVGWEKGLEDLVFGFENGLKDEQMEGLDKGWEDQDCGFENDSEDEWMEVLDKGSSVRRFYGVMVIWK